MTTEKIFSDGKMIGTKYFRWAKGKEKRNNQIKAVIIKKYELIKKYKNILLIKILTWWLIFEQLQLITFMNLEILFEMHKWPLQTHEWDDLLCLEIRA